MEMKKKDIQKDTILFREKILETIRKHPKLCAWDMLPYVFSKEDLTKPKKMKSYKRLLSNLKVLRDKDLVESKVVDSDSVLPKRIYWIGKGGD